MFVSWPLTSALIVFSTTVIGVLSVYFYRESKENKN